ncbi:sigma-70 family RNA polymerase sigma factor [Desulfovibrio ferrophilus]|uniref:RNA polymerase sigma factor n=1 Tax=Desulfovibrio ferrophilus TaxID=241368 RepID=A0A2Z6AX92_9BACT|nr:RNA polymerase factor sigma-32 [Desulfovibrio ferrophilus]BBD07869.1 RNA polymerase sigma factor [Desulfovibrio ferrophilus]
MNTQSSANSKPDKSPQENPETPEVLPPEDDLLLEAIAEEGIDDLPEPEDLFVLAPRTGSDVVPKDPLQMYLREIGKFSMLKPEEEFELARRVRDEGDSDAAFRLVSSHLRLVVKIAMDFQRRWMQNVLDLIQEGNVGLMRAVQKFDPDKGIKFSYYAAFWIKAYILKFIMDNWRLVKIGTTQAQRKLFYNLNKERQRLQNLGFDPNSATLAENLGVSEDVVIEMDQRLSRQDMSLNLPLGEEGGATRMDFLPALQPGVEDTLAQDEIAETLHGHLKSIAPHLNEKELDILELRLLSDSPVTLREIGEKYGVTRERVRQIEARLLQKLKKHLTDQIQDFSQDWINRNE